MARKVLGYSRMKRKGYYSWRKRYSGVGISRQRPKRIHIYK